MNVGLPGDESDPARVQTPVCERVVRDAPDVPQEGSDESFPCAAGVPPSRARGAGEAASITTCCAVVKKTGKPCGRRVKDPDSAMCGIHRPRFVCAVCLESNTDPAVRTPCGHKFHVACLQKWTARFVSTFPCPVCRCKLTCKKVDRRKKMIMRVTVMDLYQRKRVVSEARIQDFLQPDAVRKVKRCRQATRGQYVMNQFLKYFYKTEPIRMYSKDLRDTLCSFLKNYIVSVDIDGNTSMEYPSRCLPTYVLHQMNMGMTQSPCRATAVSRSLDYMFNVAL